MTIRAFVTGVSLVAYLASVTAPALAQVAPGNRGAAPAARTTTAPAMTLGDLPQAIVVQEPLYDGRRPLSVTRETARRDSPVYTWDQFKSQYKPRRGADGSPVDPDAETLYRVIASSNKELCDEAGMLMNELVQIDAEYSAVDEDYLALSEVYDRMPRHLKRGAAVMTIAQAGASGALCALSLGLYCIAAVAIAGGNVVSTYANLKLQLANVRLSTANIRHSRANIRHSRATVRMDALWVRAFAPYCSRFVAGWSAPELQRPAAAQAPTAVQKK